MALYDHEPYCNRGRLTVFSNNPHNARCEDCRQRFCSLCNGNVHFPATCTEMWNWKARTYLGPGHFNAFNWTLSAWTRFDGMQLALTAVRNKYTEGFILPEMFQAIFDELEHTIHLMRWSSVVVWHYPIGPLFDIINTLDKSFDDLLVAVNAQPNEDLLQNRNELQGLRVSASTAAVSVLSLLAFFGGRNQDGSVFQEIERCRTRPLRGCPPE